MLSKRSFLVSSLVLLIVLPIFNPERAAAHAGRIEIHAFQSLTLSTEKFLAGSKDGTPVTLGGELRLPNDNPRHRVPAIVILHGAGGLLQNSDAWASQFNSLGIAAFLLDSFTGRGLVSTSLDKTQLDALPMAYDAYRALELLSKHPRIDPNRIGVLGFSKGAHAAIYAAMTRFEKSYGAPDSRFALHIGFYGHCSVTYKDDTLTTGKPIRLFHGELDDTANPQYCRDYVARLQASGKDAKMIVYPRAAHVFDSIGPAMVEANETNRSNCKLREKEGQLINIDTGKVFTYEDGCMAPTRHWGYSPGAHAASIREVSKLLLETIARKP